MKQPTPYRIVAKPEPEPPAQPLREPLGRFLAAHTSTARALHLDWKLVGAAGCALIGSGAVLIVNGIHLIEVFLVAFATAAFGGLTMQALRAARLEVRRHEDGLIVRRGAATSAIAYDDVDQVWLEFDRVKFSPMPAIPLVHAFRLVERGGSQVRVSTQVESAVELMNAVLRACSWPLRVPAKEALAAGEPLRFGKVELNGRAIHVGSASVAWTDLQLVRICADRVEFFRGQRILPWRSIRLDSVPHPTVFAELVGSLAVRVERERPWWRAE